MTMHMHDIQNFLRDRYSFFNNVDPKFYHYKGVQNAFLVGDAIDKAVKNFHVNKSKRLDFKVNSKTDQAICLSTIDQYFRKYKEDYFHSYEAPEWDVGGIICRPDLIARTFFENKLVIIEIKTAAIEVSSLETLDFQTMMYCWAAHKILGEVPIGVIKRMLKKPRIRLKKNETENDYIKRIVCYEGELISSDFREINLHMIEEFEKYLSRILEDMFRTDKYYFYKNAGDYYG